MASVWPSGNLAEGRPAATTLEQSSGWLAPARLASCFKTSDDADMHAQTRFLDCCVCRYSYSSEVEIVEDAPREWKCSSSLRQLHDSNNPTADNWKQEATDALIQPSDPEPGY